MREFAVGVLGVREFAAGAGLCSMIADPTQSMTAHESQLAVQPYRPKRFDYGNENARAICHSAIVKNEVSY